MEKSCVKKLKKLNVLMYELNANGIYFVFYKAILILRMLYLRILKELLLGINNKNT